MCPLWRSLRVGMLEGRKEYIVSAARRQHGSIVSVSLTTRDTSTHGVLVDQSLTLCMTVLKRRRPSAIFAWIPGKQDLQTWNPEESCSSCPANRNICHLCPQHDKHIICYSLARDCRGKTTYDRSYAKPSRHRALYDVDVAMVKWNE